MVSNERQVPANTLRRRNSIRWRLPLISGVFVAVLLSAFLWAAYREVEQTLVHAAGMRASAAAQEVAGRLSAALAGAIAAGDAVQHEPAVARFIRQPSEASREPASQALRPDDPAQTLWRYEIWDARGNLLLELANARADTSLLDSFPMAPPPDGPGVSDFDRSGRFAYFTMVSEIGADSAGGGPLGFVRRYGQLTSAGMSIRRLLGRDAVIKIGSPGSLVWTDFFTAVPPIPPRADAIEPVYGNGTGGSWVGGLAEVAGAPWQVWVAYPTRMVVAPANAFLRRIIVVALLFLAAAVVLATLIGVRLTRPLHELATAAERIAGGEYGRHVTAERKDEIGVLSRSFNTMTDRIELAYDALRKNLEQTQFLLATARIGVWESDIDVDRIACSDSMRVVHGRPDEAVPRRRQAFLKHVHPDDRDALRRVLIGKHGSGDTIDIEYRTMASDGSTHWIEGKARMKLDDQRRPIAVLGVSMDVTDRRRLESQLRQAQKMEAVGQLAGGVAHDFNNLLTAIVGHAEMLREELPEQTPTREDADEILKAAQSAAALTRQLLAFSRKQVRQPDVIRVNTVVSGTGNLLRRLIGENIHVVTHLATDIAAVRADPSQLEQVLVNLVVNARDAMPSGGTLTIATANVDVAEPHENERGTVPAGRYVTLTVSDTGTGMDEETQRHLFEPFFTTKAPGKGSGLGLATVFGIVEQSGGAIEVDSEPGRGSDFRIYLPATTEAPRPTESDTDADAVRPAGGGETILVVEDNASVRTIAKTILERIGYRVLVAESGEEALRIVERPGALDLVVTDVVMTGITGPELARQLSSRYPDLHVLFTSGYTGDAILRHGIEDSGALFLEKPYTPASLAAEVRRALRRTSGPVVVDTS